MIKILCTSTVLLLVNLSFAQLTPSNKKPGQETARDRAKDERNHNCIYKQTYSAAARKKFFPFKTAAIVQIVSFDKDSGEVTPRLPMVNRHVNHEKLKEVKSLSDIQIDSLTDILYNVRYRGAFFTIEKIMCYEPRNAILFNDSIGKTFAYIELCFQCTGFKTNLSKVKTGDFCNQKFEMLRSFFRKNDIHFGTERETGIKKTN